MMLDHRNWRRNHPDMNTRTFSLTRLAILILFAAHMAGILGTNRAVAQTNTNASAPEAAKLTGAMVLWYRQPGQRWLDGLPLGNGMTAAMVFGGTKSERIALNNSTFWSGRPHDYDDPDAGKYFQQIKDLVFADKFQEAEKLADSHFYGKPNAQQAYQPLGDLMLTFDGADEISNYRRELDMETGVAKVSYKSGDTLYTREVFVSYPDKVMVVRLTADKPGRVSVEAQFKGIFLTNTIAKPGSLVMQGCWKGPNPRPSWLIAQVDGLGLRYQASLQALAEGGQSEATTNSVRIQKANAVTFLVTTATSFVNYHDISGDPAVECDKILAACAGKDFATLRSRHVADFRNLMGRVHLAVGDPAKNDKPIDERLAAVRPAGVTNAPGPRRGGGPLVLDPAAPRDPNLEALIFQFGRYILASSSRVGGQPANLQGIWDEDTVPNWGSKWTININTEMNYWSAEVCNLSECHQPLFDLIKDLSVAGAKTARVYYNCTNGGWAAHHNTDLWRGTAPVDAARYGMWPVGGAWLCQHIWEHYAFGGDKDFLKEYYPLMKGSAKFFMEIMVEDPKHHWLVTPFSMSPEHGYYDSQDQEAWLSPGPTMDIAILRDLFPHCIEASKILGVDADFRAQLEAALTKMPPYRFSTNGWVMEWTEDWRPGPEGHNVSANFPFFPGNSITLHGSAPEFGAGYSKWMDAHPPGGGWQLSWGIAMHARLERGNMVAALIQRMVSGRSLGNNLHNTGSNQSDANFGYTAGIAEALLQSHAGEISFLPALPAGWTDGALGGLRARGGYEVSMQWKGGKLQFADIFNTNGGTFKARNGDKTATLTVKPGQVLRINADLVAAN
jgi:alpha-L-fucosidase 2